MRTLAFFSMFFLTVFAQAQTISAHKLQTVQNFINEMVNQHHFDKNQLNLLFSQVQIKLLEKSKNKTTKKPKRKKPMSWDRYKSLFITTDRINNGVDFWGKNRHTLERAEKIYNVPKEIIVAILGIETNYGNNQGKHPTFKTLVKRSFSNDRRKKFYKSELKSFLLMVRENNLAPMSISGSHAGAMGYGQFISSSYRNFAVDFDNDGVIDLFNSPADAIGSIANYFDRHQWHDGGEISRPIKLNQQQLKLTKRSTTKPRKNAKYWKKQNFPIDKDINNQTKIALIRLPQDGIDEPRLTFWNFYVLTRYNHDNRYAMAAQLLSEKIKQKINP